MRKLLLLLLLFGFWVIVLLPLTVGNHSGSLTLPAAAANPSGQPLPRAWANGSGVQVSGANAAVGSISAVMEASQGAGSACPSQYTIQRGDTLGSIAKRCGVSLAELLGANPAISNPNRIYPGQSIFVYGSRGGGSAQPEAAAAPVVAESRGAILPGGEVLVQAQGLPPNAAVRVGLGISRLGYQVLGGSTTDANGSLTLMLSLPQTVRGGDECFVMVLTQAMPMRQVKSERFVVGQ